jgi:predicted nucleic acid-binding protein
LIVLDSSAAVDFVARLEPGEWVEATIGGELAVHAPHVLDVEVLGALRKLALTGTISDAEAAAAVAAFSSLRVRRYAHTPLVPRMWELRHVVTAADAAFVALAEFLEARLVTTDGQLARAPGLGVEILSP